jgi:hypothetical protein
MRTSACVLIMFWPSFSHLPADPLGNSSFPSLLHPRVCPHRLCSRPHMHLSALALPFTPCWPSHPSLKVLSMVAPPTSTPGPRHCLALCPGAPLLLCFSFHSGAPTSSRRSSPHLGSVWLLLWPWICLWMPCSWSIWSFPIFFPLAQGTTVVLLTLSQCTFWFASILLPSLLLSLPCMSMYHDLERPT